MGKKSAAQQGTREVEAIRHLARVVGVPVGFINNLDKEDDWSLIVKLHALLESAVTYLLVEHFNDPKITDFLAELPMSDVKKGKHALLSQLNLLDSQSRKYIRALSEVRNDFVHDVKNVITTLKEYKRDSPEKFANRFYPEIKTQKVVGMDWQQLVDEHPRVVVIQGGVRVLVQIYEKKSEIRGQPLLDALMQRQILEALKKK